MKFTPERIDEIKIHVRSFGLAAIIGTVADWVARAAFRPIHIYGIAGGFALLFIAVALTKKKD